MGMGLIDPSVDKGLNIYIDKESQIHAYMKEQMASLILHCYYKL